MNTYAIEFCDHMNTEVAATPGKAKYQFYKGHEIGDYLDFGDFVKQITCKCLHKFSPRDLFRNDDTFERVKSQRGIEFAYLGMKVEMDSKKGVIVGGNSSLNLDICFDGESWSDNCHPWYRMRYFDKKGNLIKEYGD